MGNKSVIYAVDFDGTLCESMFPEIGVPNMALINHLIKRREQGHKVILWTCRVGEWLQNAVEWCKELGLEFDAVILFNVNDVDYSTELDKQLLYVATTRALHDICILHTNKPSKFIEKYFINMEEK